MGETLNNCLLNALIHILFYVGTLFYFNCLTLEKKKWIMLVIKYIYMLVIIISDVTINYKFGSNFYLIYISIYNIILNK